MATKTRIISLCSKTKDCCFLTIRRVYHQFKKMILQAVTIKLYCFKLFLEQHFCSNNGPFVFSIILSLLLTACKVSNKSNKRLLRYCTFIISLSCRIASVTSYLSGNEAKIFKMATSILLKSLILKWDISRSIWRIEANDSSFFFSFFTLFHSSLTFFDRSFLLKTGPSCIIGEK